MGVEIQYRVSHLNKSCETANGMNINLALGNLASYHLMRSCVLVRSTQVGLLDATFAFVKMDERMIDDFSME